MLNKKIKEFKTEAFISKEKKFKTITEKDFENQWSILFFYPADFTFVCPTELEDLADHYEEFKKLGVEIYSVSTDTQFTHKEWHSHSKAISKIQFPMLADPTGKLSKQLKVYNKETGLAYRASFVINPDGIIKLVELNDDGIGRNASELLRKVKAAKFVAENDGQVCPAKWNEGDKTLEPSIDLVGKL